MSLFLEKFLCIFFRFFDQLLAPFEKKNHCRKNALQSSRNVNLKKNSRYFPRIYILRIYMYIHILEREREEKANPDFFLTDKGLTGIIAEDPLFFSFILCNHFIKHNMRHTHTHERERERENIHNAFSFD